MRILSGGQDSRRTPTTSERRLISLLTRSSGFVDAICGQCSLGKSMCRIALDGPSLRKDRTHEGGRMFMERPAGYSWNRWPDDVEYAVKIENVSKDLVACGIET